MSNGEVYGHYILVKLGFFTTVGIVCLLLGLVATIVRKAYKSKYKSTTNKEYIISTACIRGFLIIALANLLQIVLMCFDFVYIWVQIYGRIVF